MKVLAISLSSFAKNQTRELAVTPITINIRKPIRKSTKKTVPANKSVKKTETEFTKESVKMKSIGIIISKLFSKVFHYGGDKNSMKPDDNINSDKKIPLGKHVIRGGLPPRPKIKN